MNCMQVVKRQNIKTNFKWVLMVVSLFITFHVSAQIAAPQFVNTFPLHNPTKYMDYKMSSAQTRPMVRSYIKLDVRVPNLSPTAFFCRQEIKADSKSSFKPRFRLGSYDYVNYLEGK